MLTIKELRDKWNSMDSSINGYLRLSGHHPLAFHFGYNYGKKCFVVVDVKNDVTPKSSKAITVIYQKPEKMIYFILNQTSLEEIFVKLCWDLMVCSANARNPVGRLLLQYNNWLKLFSLLGKKGMSAESQKGLLGELLFLEEKIKEIGYIAAINSWTGPDGADQDFEFSDGWAEIKNVSIATENVTISSLQQLDRNDLGSLVVYHMDKTSSETSGNVSLNQKIDDIRATIRDQHALDCFNVKLLKYGYMEEERDFYNDTKFRFGSREEYIVGCNFPKLTRQTVPSAVTGLSYSLSLAAIDIYKKVD